jgi:phosphoribosylanthranilate isomerase
MQPRIKICGVSRHMDVLAAARAGAHAIGLNFVPESPRYIGGLERAQELRAAPGLLWVGVFVHPPLHTVLSLVEALRLDVVQLHGEERPEYVGRLRRRLAANVAVWKAIRVAAPGDLEAAKDYPCDAWLIDAKVAGVRGGSGQTFDWGLLQGFARTKPLVLSGGLNPANVAEAVREVRPDWVDAASGVESAPGIKDAELMRRFVEAALTEERC